MVAPLALGTVAVAGRGRERDSYLLWEFKVPGLYCCQVVRKEDFWTPTGFAPSHASKCEEDELGDQACEWSL